MKKKDLIFYASAAVLMAVSAQVAKADELVSNDSVKTEGNQTHVEKATVAATTDMQLSNATTSYTAPANVTEQSTESVVSEAPSESLVSTKEKDAVATIPDKIEGNSVQSTGTTTFYNTGANAPAGRSTDVAVQPKSFVDVSSHNGNISIAEYRTLANKGVGGVVVKLTEDTWYNNPNAENQIRNAQAAGLQVSTYHFSRYTSEESARAEARFYITAAQRLSLPKNTLMVNDFEDAKMQPNINRNTQAWVDEMRKNGYTNLMFYTSASWLDENNLRKKGPVNTAQFGLQNFWVAQYPAPKLSVEDAKSLRYNGKAGAWQFSSQAELLLGKHLFDHSVDYTGRFTANAKPAADPTVGNLSGTINIVNNDTMAGRFDVVISNVKAPNGVQTVSVPIWSEINGQDDIIWYTADRQNNGTYTVNVKASAHKNSTGLYNVHLYYVQNDGQLTGVGGTTTNVYIGKRLEDLNPSGTVTIENNNTSTGTFDAVVRNVVAPNGLKEVLIPTWSNQNWQDDLIWHKAVRQSDGSYRATIKASEHKNDTGKYNVHVYYVDNNNQRNYITETTTEVRQSYPSGTVTIENNNVSTGTFDAVVRNVVAPNGLKEVLIPTWSNQNWQDDLIWHKAVRQSDGSYRATIKASEHKNDTGKYNVHVYYVDNDHQRNYITETTTEVRQSRLSGTILIQNNNKDTGTFDVIIKDVYSPKGVQTVQVPTWSDKDGQDDIRWYEATRQANGDYKVSVKASDHKNSTGKYFIHLYYIQNDGSLIGVGGTSTEVEFRNAKIKTQAYIKDVNSNNGTYTVVVDQAPQGRQIKNIRVAAWSQAHQENLYWYATAPYGMHTEVQVSAANHQYQKGNYTTHVYVDYVDGGVEGFNLGQTALSPRVTADQTAYNPRVSNGQRDRILRAAASLVGVRGGSAAHHQLVNDYNSVRPLPVGYAVKNSDDWCDIFVTTVFQREGLSGLIGRECGVERHIQIFKRLGIWNEDGTSTPKAGDIITFNWDQNSQQNNGFADHIGIVESVSNGFIHTIEGNSNDQVRRNTYRIGHGNIRGFASPRYQ